VAKTPEAALATNSVAPPRRHPPPINADAKQSFATAFMWRHNDGGGFRPNTIDPRGQLYSCLNPADFFYNVAESDIIKKSALSSLWAAFVWPPATMWRVA
jgi:hypothetical protein